MLLLPPLPLPTNALPAPALNLKEPASVSVHHLLLQNYAVGLPLCRGINSVEVGNDFGTPPKSAPLAGTPLSHPYFHYWCCSELP